MIKTRSIFFTLICTILLGFHACSDNEVEESEGSNLRIEITDAPIDDANIEGAFMTFTGVKLDGKTYNFESAKTIEVSALTEGNTTVLFNDEVAADSYSEVTLLLDYEKDDEGNSPGCYVLTSDMIKHDLATTNNATGEIKVNNSELDLMASESTEAIVDIDLRKAIEREDNENDKYNFSSNTKAATRMIVGTSFVIDGNIEDQIGFTDDKVIVYAYKDGTFSTESETSNQNAMFANAVTSTSVKSDGSFSLHFLQDGEYELVFVNYEKREDNSFEATALLEINAGLNVDTWGLDISSNTTLNLLVIGAVAI